MPSRKPYAGAGGIPEDKWHDQWAESQGPLSRHGFQELRPVVRSLREISITDWNVTFRSGGEPTFARGPATWQDRIYLAHPGVDNIEGTEDDIYFFDSDNSYPLSMVFAKLEEPIRPGQSVYLWIEHDAPEQMQTNLWLVTEDYDPLTLTWGNQPSSSITHPDDEPVTWNMISPSMICSAYTIGVEYPSSFDAIEVTIASSSAEAADSFRIGTLKASGAPSASPLRDNTVYGFAFSISSFGYQGNQTISLDNFDCRVWPVAPAPI